MERWDKAFLSKYHITDSYLKKDLKDLILQKDDSSETKKWCSSTKTTLDMLREKWYELEYWQWSYLQEQKKIALTYKEWMSIMDWYKYSITQPLWDMWSEYYYEEKHSFQYWDFFFVIKPDRYKIEYKWKQYSIQQYKELLTENWIWLEYESLDERKAFSKWNATCVIRDFKTSSNISRLKDQLRYWDEFGYLVSMSFYYAIIHMMTGIEDITVLLDIIELPSSTGDVVNIPIQELREKFKRVWSNILKLMDKIDNNQRECPTHEMILSNKKIKEYAKYIPSKQTTFTYLQVNDENFF